MKILPCLLIMLAISQFTSAQKSLVGYWQKEVGFQERVTMDYIHFSSDNKGEMGLYWKEWGIRDSFLVNRNITRWMLRSDTLTIYSFPKEGPPIVKNNTYVITKLKGRFIELKDITNFEIMTEAEIKLLSNNPLIKYYKIRLSR